MYKYKKYIIFLFLGLLLLPCFSVVNAQSLDSLKKGEVTAQQGKFFLDKIVGESYNTYATGEGEYSLVDLIAKIVLVFISLLGIFFIILLIYAGYLWMTAGGNEDQVEKSKGMIKHAVIGLVIVLSAFAISWWILGKISGQTLNI
ncbi:pilin [Patescibacteria group bacterium]